MRVLPAVVCVLSVCVAFSATSAESDAPGGGTIVFGRGADSITLDPAAATEMESAKVIESIYEGLVHCADDGTQIEPCLAASWERSDDGKTWTFHLRDNVLFHDGTPFDAEAVVDNFTRQIDPAHRRFQSDFAYAPVILKYVTNVEALDDRTVRITLSQPYAPFLHNMAMFSAKIASPRALKHWGKAIGHHPVGTGPFRFEEWRPNDRIILKRNDQYWGDKAKLDRVVFRSIPDNAARFKAFRDGRVDAMDGINPGDVAKIEELPNTTLVSRPGLNVGYLAMNTTKPPFDNAKVRQAVNHAVNKPGLIKVMYRGLAAPAKTPLPPTLWGHNDEIVDYTYDPDKAMELLAEAGFKDGFESTLWTMRIPRPYMPRPLDVARLIQSNLAEVGIHVRVVSHTWDDYNDKVENGEHDMCLLGWIGDNGDPDNFLYVLLDRDNAVKGKAMNCAFFDNERLHELLVAAQQTQEFDERVRLYKEAQQIVHDEAPWVPLAHARQIVAARDNVTGIVVHPTGVLRFDRAHKE